MKISLTKRIDRPLLDWLGGPKGPFSSLAPSLTSYINDENPDILLCPHDLFDLRTEKEYLRNILRLADDFPLIVSNRGDQPIHLCHRNIYSVQTSIEVGQFCPKHKTIVVPYNIQKSSTLSVREYFQVPTISFVGYVPKLTLGRIGRSILPFPPGPLKRNGALVRYYGVKEIQSLSNSLLIVRPNYSATFKILRDEPIRRLEYWNSIMSSDLVYSPRGDGNSSQRFYEALSAGRHAIVPDTNIYLPTPLMDKSNEYFLVIRPNSKNLKERVNKFWSQIDSESYLSRQTSIMEFFNKFLYYPDYIQNLFSSSHSAELNKLVANHKPIS